MDIALIPWAVRYHVLPLYKGPEFAISTDDSSLAGYHEWLAAVQALPAVVDTVPDEAEYVAHIKKYADGVAQSKVRWRPSHAPVPASLPAHTRAAAVAMQRFTPAGRCCLGLQVADAVRAGSAAHQHA